MWKQWVNAILGLAVIVVPFLGLSAMAMAWTLAIMGAVVLVLSLWTTGEVSNQEYDQVVTHHRHSHA